ncbi:MAG: Prokaryotic metallothionein [Campylobacteraceae bacterium]|nr:Prokaryotic metallothionein [Campylobacteraceae bacterium]
MLFKIILFVILIYIVYTLFFGKKKEKKQTKNGSEEELMVECASCKIFIGISEAIKKDGQYFCSQKCAKEKQ